ncbi:hypothetical protein M501DRAFT_1018074 [Patellaria atrata CBS 101060]|uniref:Histone deacetylase interacting domain-containing protein n=1 Tax=Patellaria atrata CBS 101060 TaxID=1346257 RepID=A0A9P4VR44_9PEZI|nr:hypothetical protein M501DRAFT_1018074 [Patellaria atrata CBS 101060]
MSDSDQNYQPMDVSDDEEAYVRTHRAYSSDNDMDADSEAPTVEQGNDSSGRGKELERPEEIDNDYAIEYVGKIQDHFAKEPEKFKEFIAIIETYELDKAPIRTIYRQVRKLFEGDRQLFEQFRHFLPEGFALGNDRAILEEPPTPKKKSKPAHPVKK